MIRPVHTIRSCVVAAVGMALLGASAPASALTAPAAPSTVTASFGSGSVALAWVDNSPDEAGFAIERCLGAGCTSFGQIATVAAGVTSYGDTFYSSGTDRYRVRAFNSAGYSVASNTAEVSLFSIGDVFPSMSATPTAGLAPLTVGFDGSASTTLNGTITGYTWSFGDGQTGSGAVVSHTYTTPGVYAASLKVTSAGTFGGSASTALLVTVAAPPLVAPGDLAATSPVRNQIRLAWSNPVSSATGLALERCKGSGCTSFTRIAVLTTATTSYTDTTVKNRTTYRYRLAASTSAATVYSNVVTATAR